MKRTKQFFLTLSLILCVSIVFGQATKSAVHSKSVKKQIVLNKSDMSRTAFSATNSASQKATWDVLYTFTTQAAGEQAVETDGTYIYTTAWGGTGEFNKYDMTGTFIETFTIANAGAIRDLAFDGTYFYGSNATMNLYKLDFTNHTLVSTITATCTGITGIRHCTYDPTLDGGNGGFWIGNWTELGAISMTGAQLVAGVTGNVDCYGSAIDIWTDQANPRVILFQQGGSGVELHGFDINTSTFTGLLKDAAADIPNFVAGESIAGGLASYESNGKLILLGNVQQDPNLIFAYELALTADPGAPGLATNLVATPGADGAMEVSMAWTNPTLTSTGATLTELTSVSLYIDAVTTPLYTNSSPTIGGNENQTAIDLSAYTPGYHTFKVVGTNTAGVGLTASITAWIGYNPPANIVVTPEDITAGVVWTQIGTPNSWDYELVLDGVAATGTPTGNTTTNPLTISSLTAATAYDLYMRAVYTGGNSVWVGPISFNTLHCPSANQCAYVLNFTDSWGDGWNGASVEVTQGGVSLGIFTITGGAAGTQTVNLCNGSAIDLIFTQGSYPEECGFSITDPFGEVLYSFAATAEPAAGSLFTFNADCTPPTCPKPTALSVGSITTTTASLSWTEGGTETLWNIEMGVAGFTPTGTPTNTGVSNPFNATSLTEGTYYTYYVQADCGAGDVSLWAGPFTFNTTCSAVTQYTWFDDLESGIACYQVSGINANATWYWDNVTGAPNTGLANITCEYDGALGNQDEWIKSPVFDLTGLSMPSMKFFWNMSYTWAVSPDDNYDVFLKATTDGTTWTELWTEPTATFEDWTWYEQIIDLAAFGSSTTFQFAFQYVGNDGAAAYIDDITIDNNVSVKPNNIKPVSVYPNPTNGMLYISETAQNVTVTDMLGNVLISAQMVKSIDLSILSQGMYIVKVTNGENTQITKINLAK